MSAQKKQSTKNPIAAAVIPLPVSKNPALTLLAPILLLEHSAGIVLATKSITVHTLLLAVQERKDMPSWLASATIHPMFATAEATALLATELADDPEAVFALIALLGKAARTTHLEVPHELMQLFRPPNAFECNQALSEIVCSARLSPAEMHQLVNSLEHFWSNEDFTSGLALQCRSILESSRFAKAVAQKLGSTYEDTNSNFTEKLMEAFSSLPPDERNNKTKVFHTASSVHDQFMISTRVQDMRVERGSGPAPASLVVGAREQVDGAGFLAGVATHGSLQPPAQPRKHESNALGRRRQRSRQRNDKQPRAQGGPAGDTNLKCYNCGGIGHKRNVCPSPVRQNSVGAQRDEAPAHMSPMTLIMHVAVPPASTSLQRSVLLSTGAPKSAISAELAHALRTNMRPHAHNVTYSGVGGAAIDVIGTVVSVSLARVAGGAPDLVLHDVLVVRGLQWPVMVGLPDISRLKSLNVTFTRHGAVVTLGAGEPLIAPRQAKGAPLRALSTSTPDAPVVAPVGPTRSADEADAGPPATVVSFSPGLKPKPEIAYHSVAETAHRKAFQAVHATAYQRVSVNQSLSPSTLTEIEAVLAQTASVFALKLPNQKPPVLNAELANTWPLQLMLKPGIEIRTPPHRSTCQLAELAAEEVLLIQTQRAVEARHALAIAPASVAAKGRIVHAHIDSNRICMGSAYPMPNTERQCAAMAAFQGSHFFQSDIFEAFSQWPLAQGSGAAACIDINNKILQPMVAPMGVASVPAAFNHLIAGVFSIRTDDFMVMTYCDDIIGVARTEAAWSR